MPFLCFKLGTFLTHCGETPSEFAAQKMVSQGGSISLEFKCVASFTNALHFKILTKETSLRTIVTLYLNLLTVCVCTTTRGFTQYIYNSILL